MTRAVGERGMPQFKEINFPFSDEDWPCFDKIFLLQKRLAQHCSRPVPLKGLKELAELVRRGRLMDFLGGRFM